MGVGWVGGFSGLELGVLPAAAWHRAFGLHGEAAAFFGGHQAVDPRHRPAGADRGKSGDGQGQKHRHQKTYAAHGSSGEKREIIIAKNAAFSGIARYSAHT